MGAHSSGGAVRRERGSVTAESALVLPLVAAFALALVWLISIGISQIQAVDAARDAARGLARGEDETSVRALAERTAPAGSTVSIAESDGAVTVTVSVHAEPPGWLLVPLPPVAITSQSKVEVEDDAAAG
ncbi:MAG: TadE family type IV pilus minor pilin [Nocardioidaceae bacterium]